MDDKEVFERVRKELVTLMDTPGNDARSITMESDLIADLGLDSLKFVDLTVALEDTFRVDCFPMQEWVDSCIDRGVRLTVRGLVEACTKLAVS
jgi:acyl carrier protein